MNEYFSTYISEVGSYCCYFCQYKSSSVANVLVHTLSTHDKDSVCPCVCLGQNTSTGKRTQLLWGWWVDMIQGPYSRRFTESAVTKIVRTVFCRWAETIWIRILERGTADFGSTNRNVRIGTLEKYFRFCTAQISNVDRLSSTSCST